MPIGSHHHRERGATVREALVGRFTVTTAGVEVKVGATPFAGRHSIIVINDSSNLIFLRVGAIPDLAAGLFFIAFSGESITFTNDQDQPMTLFAKTDENPVSIRVSEVR